MKGDSWTLFWGKRVRKPWIVVGEENKLKKTCKHFQIYYTKNGKKVKFCITHKNENSLNVFGFRKIEHISQKLKK